MSHKDHEGRSDVGGPIQKLYKIRQVAEMLGNVSVKTLRREIAAGRLKTVRVRPGRNAPYLLTSHEVNRWLAEECSRSGNAA